MSDTQIDAIEAPRRTTKLIGHAEAERAFLSAWKSGRIAHGWLIGGPPGIGKASFAWACARLALAEGQGKALNAGADSKIARQVAAGSHPGVHLVRRSINPDTSSPRLRSEIAVNDIRALQPFFHQTAPHWRVAIIDAADEMSSSAANALLKLLEEPPTRALLLLVCHAPGRLLPTLLSRCRRLALRPLSIEDTLAVMQSQAPEMPLDEARALALITGGSPGRALALHAVGGVALYRELVGLLARYPSFDGEALHALAERCGGSGEGEANFDAAASLLTEWLAELVRFGAGGSGRAEAAPGEVSARARLLAARPVDAWLAVWDKITAQFARADGLALDRKQAMLNAFFAVATA
ncbi:MAG: DNA polymerase III subunit delta' [Alphaproteobacteria bacterium]|nr:DNA polymerase III subunit delta' [Alphaproteobacteria bacterium]